MYNHFEAWEVDRLVSNLEIWELIILPQNQGPCCLLCHGQHLLRNASSIFLNAAERRFSGSTLTS